MTTSQDLTCKEIVELVTEYLERALPEDTREAFEEHLGRCNGCVDYLEFLRETIRLVGTLRDESLPPDVRDELILAFRRSAAL